MNILKCSKSLCVNTMCQDHGTDAKAPLTSSFNLVNQSHCLLLALYYEEQEGACGRPHEVIKRLIPKMRRRVARKAGVN